MNIVQKYGKSFDNKAILRTPQWIENQITKATRVAHKFSKHKKKTLTQCPMCQSKQFHPFSNIYGFIYMQCENCDNLFLQNPLEDLNQLYTNDGKESSFECYLDDEIWEKRKNVIAIPKVEFISEVATRFQNKKGYWLDIGSGGGEILWVAREMGYQIRGFESDTKALNFSNEKLKGNIVSAGFLDINACQEDLLQEIKKADIITFFNVLEHLENPKGTIEFLLKEMKPNALLVLEIPRHPSLASFANLASPNRVYRHCIPPFHLNIFNEKSILQVANNWGGGGKTCR